MRLNNKLIVILITIVMLMGMTNVRELNQNSPQLNLPTTNQVPDQNNLQSNSFFENSKRTLTDFVNQNGNQQSRPVLNDYSLPSQQNLVTNGVVDQVTVAFDMSHIPLYTSIYNLQADLQTYGVETLYIDGEFIIPEEANVLLLSASMYEYTPEDLQKIDVWYNSGGPKLIWVAGDSDFAGEYHPDSSNAILDTLGSNLRIAADAIADDVNNDGASYRVAATMPVCDGSASCAFNDQVGSAMFHGPTSVMGYIDGNVVDLNTQYYLNLGVQVVMKTSYDSYALDQDGSGTEYDYYSSRGYWGPFPVLAFQDMGDSKYVIASGESIFSDYQMMYSMQTPQGVWDGGNQQGKLLVDNIFTWFGVNRIIPLPVTVAFDMSHGPLYTTINNLAADLQLYGVNTLYIDGEFIIPEEATVLLLSASMDSFSMDEMAAIYNWFYGSGAHLLWVAGDSDFAGEYQADSSNAILAWMGSKLRISADAIADDYNNDGASYRVAAQSPACEGELSCIFTDGVGSTMFHGPASVLGYNGHNPVDLNNNPIQDVEVVMRTSSDSYALDQDGSGTQYDYYSTNGIYGNYPVLAVQDMMDSHYIIASGESIFSDYQMMYSMHTPQGVWNGGNQEGKLLVDNIFTWFGVNRDVHFDSPIYIGSNEDFVNYGFPGSGTAEDPFIIESLFIVSSNENLINIWDTDAYFVIRNNYLDGMHGWVTGIFLSNVRNGLIEYNNITGTDLGMYLDRSVGNTIQNNWIYDNNGGINLWESREITINENEITNTMWSPIAVSNERPIKFMRFNEDIQATVRDSIDWGISVLDPDEAAVRYYHDNVDVQLTLDGKPVYVNIYDVYYDDWEGQWRFDMEYYTDPLPLGTHEFEVHFYIDGVEDFSGIGHVTVTENEIVPIRFYQDATITEGDQIAWQASYLDPDLATIEEWRANSAVELNVNGVPVEVTTGDVYFDDQNGVYRFDMDYLSDPLALGEYLFEVVFYYHGEFDLADSALVTVLPPIVHDNNQISNNYIANSDQAMSFDFSNYNVINDNLIENVGATGINIWNSLGNQILQNTISYSGSGIYLDSSSSTTIIGNNISNNWGYGIAAFFVSDLNVSNNILGFNGWIGMEGYAVESGTINDNEIVGNGGEGISLSYSNNIVISGNTIYWDYIGILLSTSSHNIISDNDLYWDWGGGIGILFDSNYNVITKNIIHDMDYEDGIGLWSSSFNNITENEFYNNDDGIVSRRSANNLISENIFHDNRNGMYITSEAFDQVVMNFYQDITVTDMDNILWLATSSSYDFDYLMYENQNIVVDLTVDGYSAWVDIGGIWYDWSDGQYKYDIMSYIGILPLGEHTVAVHFYLDGVFDLEFSVTVTVVPDESSADNLITENVMFDNYYNGIQLRDSHRNEISYNEITGSGSNGIELTDSDSNLIKENEFSSISYSGVYLYHSSSNVITQNNFENNYEGISMYDSEDNLIRLNTMEENYYGIYMTYSDQNTIELNRIENSWYYGLFYYSSNDLMIDKNKFEENYVGILAYFSNNCDISKNHFTDNNYGVAILYGSDNIVEDNIFKDNTIAIFLEYTNNVELSHNKFIHNQTDTLIY